MCVLISFWSISLCGQEASSSDTLITSVYFSEDGNLISWYPVESELWNKQMLDGYQLIREEIGPGDQVINTITLADNILPKDNSWFESNSEMEEGMMGVIGKILYDPTIKLASYGEVTALDIKYNYLVYESTFSSDVAVALGLGYIDRDIASGSRYRYLVKGISSTLHSDLVTNIARQGIVSNETIQRVDFQFPDGMSLSAMRRLGNTSANDASVRITGKAYNDSLVLRWVPTSLEAWEQGKKYGYVLKKEIAEGQWQEVAKLEPWSLGKMKTYVTQDSMLMAAAGALYPVQSSMQDMDATGRLKIANNLMGFGLLAAERSVLAAEALALRFVDYEVVDGLRYSYEIGINESNTKVGSGSLIIDNIFEKLKGPEDLYAITGDGEVSLVWSISDYNDKFSFYFIERSTDGNNYTPLTDKPLIISTDGKVSSTKYIYKDSLLINGNSYLYRIKGSDSFSNWSEYSEVIGVPRDITPPSPVAIDTVYYIDSLQQMNISWISPSVEAKDLSHYQIMMSKEERGDYAVFGDRIPKGEESFTLTFDSIGLKKSYYIKLLAVDSLFNVAESAPVHMTVMDFEAPLPATNLDGIIDSTGFVTLAWNASPSDDVRGYWIFSSDREFGDYFKVDQILTEATQHQYFLSVESLNERIFYFVKAEDYAFNIGERSEVVELKRPDLIAPVSQYISRVAVNKQTSEITWDVSPSSDVQSQVIYRRMVASVDTMWTVMDSLSATDTIYVDRDLAVDKVYEYALRCIDDADNVSDYSNVKSGLLLFPSEAAAINELVISTVKTDEVMNHKVEWTLPVLDDQYASESYSVDIYRSTGSKEMKVLKTVTSSTTSYLDLKIYPNVLYNYAVVIRFDNGWTGDRSAVQSIISRP